MKRILTWINIRIAYWEIHELDLDLMFGIIDIDAYTKEREHWDNILNARNNDNI